VRRSLKDAIQSILSSSAWCATDVHHRKWEVKRYRARGLAVTTFVQSHHFRNWKSRPFGGSDYVTSGIATVAARAPRVATALLSTVIALGRG
jgi:hypothetical protein